MNPYAPSAYAVWQHSRSHRVVVPTRSKDYDDRNAGRWVLHYQNGKTRKVLLAHADIHHGNDGVMVYVNGEWVNLDTISQGLMGAVAVEA